MTRTRARCGTRMRNKTHSTRGLLSFLPFPPFLPSIEVVRVEIDIEATETVDLFGADGRHAILALQDAVHDEERLLDDGQTILREQVRADDDVGDAGFIFERQEDEAFR